MWNAPAQQELKLVLSPHTSHILLCGWLSSLSASLHGPGYPGAHSVAQAGFKPVLILYLLGLEACLTSSQHSFIRECVSRLHEKGKYLNVNHPSKSWNQRCSWLQMSTWERTAGNNKVGYIMPHSGCLQLSFHQLLPLPHLRGRPSSEHSWYICWSNQQTVSLAIATSGAVPSSVGGERKAAQQRNWLSVGAAKPWGHGAHTERTMRRARNKMKTFVVFRTTVSFKSKGMDNLQGYTHDRAL